MTPCLVIPLSLSFSILSFVGIDHCECFKFYPGRQKLSLKTQKAALKDEEKLKDLLDGKVEGSELQVKDLGPQVSWRTVFMTEYARVILRIIMHIT